MLQLQRAICYRTGVSQCIILFNAVCDLRERGHQCTGQGTRELVVGVGEVGEAAGTGRWRDPGCKGQDLASGDLALRVVEDGDSREIPSAAAAMARAAKGRRWRRGTALSAVGGWRLTGVGKDWKVGVGREDDERVN